MKQNPLKLIVAVVSQWTVFEKAQVPIEGN